MSALEKYERAPKRLKVSAEDEELEEGEESDSASAGLMGDDEEDEGQSRARWSSADRKVSPAVEELQRRLRCFYRTDPSSSDPGPPAASRSLKHYCTDCIRTSISAFTSGSHDPWCWCLQGFGHTISFCGSVTLHSFTSI